MSQPLRGALIGYGFIGARGHVPAYAARARSRGDVEIAAVADVCEARRAEAARALPGARLYADHETLLAAEADKLDFVDIATPPADHARVAHAALDRGLHVLCEKPLATGIEEARAMLAHAQRSRRVIFPCHNYKHAPVVKAVRDVITTGAIGPIHLVTLQTFRNTHARGVPEWRPDWRRDRRFSGGGIAMDHGSHTFYLAFEWMRSYPTAITARAATLGPYDTEDDVSCTLTFPGGVASAHLTWNAGVRKVLYTIHGARGAVRVEDDELEIAILDPSGTPSAPPSSKLPVSAAGARWTFERRSIVSNWMDASHVTWFDSLFDDFRRAVDARDYVGREAREAFLCVQLIATAYASAAQGSRQMPLSETVVLEDAA